MRKIFLYSILLAFVISLTSCNKSKDYTILIPTDADFVALINPKSIAEKGNFQNLEQYKFYQLFENEIKNQDHKVDSLLQNIKTSPTNAGLDIISPIYIFGQKLQSKNMIALIANMKDKSQFEEHLKIIYKGIYNQDISFDKNKDFTVIKGTNKPFMAWNKTQFIIIAPELGASEDLVKKYFEKIINDKHSLAKENKSFFDFVKKSQDINIWYTGNFLKNLSKKEEKTNKNLDFTKSSWVNLVSFNYDGISFTQKFHPDVLTKEQLRKRPMWKSKINTDFFKYFPSQSYLNIGLGIYTNNTHYIFQNQNYFSDFLEQYEINLKKLEQSFEGDALFSIYDFEIGKSFNANNFFSKKGKFIKQVVLPQFILAGKMKNKIFYDDFIATHKENIKTKENYYLLTISKERKLYITYKNDLMFVTNNQAILNYFLINYVGKDNFLDTKYASSAKNAMFGYVNINFDDYPTEVKEYIYEQIPFGNTKEVQDILSYFDYIDYRVSNEYTKTGKIHMKKTDKNSLEVILLLLDKAYTLLFSQNNIQHEN